MTPVTMMEESEWRFDALRGNRMLIGGFFFFLPLLPHTHFLTKTKRLQNTRKCNNSPIKDGHANLQSLIQTLNSCCLTHKGQLVGHFHAKRQTFDGGGWSQVLSRKKKIAKTKAVRFR